MEEAIAELQTAIAEMVGQEYQNAIHDYGYFIFISAECETDAQTSRTLYAKAIGILIASSRALMKNIEDQNAALTILVTSIAQRTKSALAREDYADAFQFYSLLDELPFEEQTHRDIARRPFREFFDKINRCCLRISNEIPAETDNTPRKTFDKLTKQFYEQALKPTQKIAKHCHFALDELQFACDNLIDCGSLIAIRLHNKYDAFQDAHCLVQPLVDLPASIAKIRSQQENFATITRHAKTERAKQLMNASQFKQALQCFQDALALANDVVERAFIEDQILECRQAIDFLKLKRKDPNLSTIWQGFVGSQIRRCLRNALWFNLLLTVVAIFGGTAAISSMRQDGPDNTTVSMLIFLIFLSVWALNNLWAILRQHQQLIRHPIARILTKYGPLEWVIHSIDSDYSSVKQLGNSYLLTPLWLLRPSFFGLKVTRSVDIIWGYSTSTRHSTNGAYTHTTYCVILRLRDKRSISIDCGGSESAATEVLQILNLNCPWVIPGYSAELEGKWNQFSEDVISEVDERRKYLMPFIDNAYPFVLAHEKQSCLAPLGGKMALGDLIQQSVLPILALAGGAICIIVFFVALSSDTSTSSNSQLSSGISNYSSPSSNSVPGSLPGHDEPASLTLQAEIDSDDATLYSYGNTIQNEKSSLASLRGKIDTYKASLKSIEAASKRGEDVDQNRYDNLLAEHNRLVREYEATRKTHNALVEKNNSLVNTRNEKVRQLKRQRGGN